MRLRRELIPGDATMTDGRATGSDGGPPLDVLIGIVGYTPVVEAFPLGPKLMALLERALADRKGVRVENMTWGPIHVVQRFQDEGAVRPDRLILVGAASICRTPGRVRAFRWCGGTLPDATMQERIYEAVTGIVDIENTLIIGSHFSVWPAETFTVEIDLSANAFGALVMAETEGRSDDAAIADELGFRPRDAIETIGRFVLDLADNGNAAVSQPQAKSADRLAPVASFTRNEIITGVNSVQRKH